MNHAGIIAESLHIREQQAQATIGLLDEGNTLPFIARYRKEVTGGLDEEQIRSLMDQLETLRSTDDRREAILKSIEEQGKLTPELKEQILLAGTKTELEDLYQPYKPKRRTRAGIAREKGLQGLADLILAQALTRQTLEQTVQPFLGEAVPSVEEALAGARDIVAETISDHAEVRRVTREKAMAWGIIQSEQIIGSEDPRHVYELYYAFELRADALRPHQILALNRGEEEKVLRVSLSVSERDWRTGIAAAFHSDRRSIFAEQMELAMTDAAERLLLPAIERDVRRTLTEKAESHAIHVFGENLRALLLQPPLDGQTVLGLDPGFRTGCKVAVVDPTGKILSTGAIYPHEPQKKWAESLAILKNLIEKHHITLISIGNGTASRETEQLAAELIRQCPQVRYVITNEAGASVYSASPLARQEMPDLDVSVRGAVSIARRIQDPLAELVKIDPQSIGVGMYQHDVDQTELAQALNGVVESVVNRVGVDVNTASPALLTHVAGIGPAVAENIVRYRDENGMFTNRAQIKKVSKLGPKAFEQSAGFLRIREGSNPLDASAIHPESYAVAEAVLKRAGIKPQTRLEDRHAPLDALKTSMPLSKLAKELGSGEPTLVDIFEQLIRPGRDPREDLPTPVLRSDVLSMSDLVPGMILKGTVRNVVDFGAFVDIGVKQDGLLHRSQLQPGQVLKVGDIIPVEILKVEAERGRISLGWGESD